MKRALKFPLSFAAGWALGALSWLFVAAWFAYREFDE